MMSDCEQPIGNNSILEAEVVMSPLRSGSLPNFFRLELWLWSSAYHVLNQIFFNWIESANFLYHTGSMAPLGTTNAAW